MFKIIIDLQVEQVHNKQKIEIWTEKNCTTISKLRIEKKINSFITKRKAW